MIVVDASVVAPALVDDGAAGDTARRRLAGENLAAPEVLYLDTISAMRGLVRGGAPGVQRAHHALADLADLPIDRASEHQLMYRCWQLRDNLAPYDAAYVALAELLRATLVTADSRLARAPGLHCEIEVLAAGTT